MISRSITKKLKSKTGPGKALLLFGPRQSGKTTLLHQVFDNQPSVLWLSGDESDVRQLLENASSSRLKAVFGDHKTVIIDEAQRINDIGRSLKLITDHLNEIRVVATGSSAFELANRTQEPLTGRKWEFFLYPFSFGELASHHGLLEEKRMLPQRLVYGSYPEVVMNPGREKEILRSLTDSFLYRDLLMLEGLKKPMKIVSLLQALAFQLGSEVSYNELGKTIGLNNETVEKYIDMLEKSYVIFRLGALSRNLRKELRKGRKIYFWDNGVRNALISQFGQIELRTDRGALWENYMVSERLKYIAYQGAWVNSWFWRTQDQQEIDYLEEHDGIFDAWEFKWSSGKKARLSKTFSGSYPNSGLRIITPENPEDFLWETVTVR